MPKVDVHPSMGDRNFGHTVEESLRANELDPKLLYVSSQQAELWRQVFLRHSPIHRNPEFARIYRDAFAQITVKLPPGRVWLIGLGCGTGLKEAQLCSHLIANGHEVLFTAVDVSRDLVSEAAQKLLEAGARSERHLVCDLAEINFIKEWLAGTDGDTPRLLTFFGLVPNFAPMFVARLMSDILRPGDLLLASVHLAPVGEEIDVTNAMLKVLPQYDNPETLAWLGGALDQWKLRDTVGEPRIIIGQMKTIPGFFGLVPWKSCETYLKWAPHGGSFADVSLLLFRSLRYTPALFEELLSTHGLQIEQLAMTACREEAIWSVKLRP